MKKLFSAGALIVLAVGSLVATLAIAQSPASAATSCTSKTVTAYGYNDYNVSSTASPPSPGRYVRHMVTVAVCVNSLTHKLSSATCTAERTAIKTNMSMIPGTYYKIGNGGAGNTFFSCDSGQSWKWNRSVLSDECASPHVYIDYIVG